MKTLFGLLHLLLFCVCVSLFACDSKSSDLRKIVGAREELPFEATVTSSSRIGAYTKKVHRVTLSSYTRTDVTVTTPKTGRKPFPAVLCIHGHDGNMNSAYSVEAAYGIYHGFCEILANNGFVTISPSFGDHTMAPMNRLMPIWINEMRRTLDFLVTLPKVNTRKIGVAGLSLGGELSMWVGALDSRIKASVVSGFVPTLAAMDGEGHDLCYDFEGLRAWGDFSDAFSLHKPDYLLLQSGERDMFRAFRPETANGVVEKVREAYGRKKGRVEYVVHPGIHEIEVNSLLQFFTTKLK